MHVPNVTELRQFYSSSLGRVVQRQLRQAVLRFWPHLSRDVLAGVGFTTPYLQPYLSQEEQNNGALVIACMEDERGALYWPRNRSNRTVLIDETGLPFADNMINRVLLIHSLEHSDYSRHLLHEIWRVLTPGGRVLAVVPHRRSFWARAHASPFAEGRPYTISQLRSTLCGDLFTHVDDDYALFFPPSNRRFLLRLIPLFQWLGRLVPMTGGVILMEAEKQIYASITEPVKRKRPKRVFAPASKPVMGYD